MHYLHQIDPVAISLGPINVHWYGLMYLCAFAAGWLLGRQYLARYGIAKQAFDDFAFYVMMGVVLGGRLGWILFYGMGGIIDDPLSALRVWEGGMSFHGGMLGVMLAAWWWSRAQKIPFWDLGDFIAPLFPLGLGFGRLGNFIGGELWGKVSDVSWAVIFPRAVPMDLSSEQLVQLHQSGALEQFARHPSQLYQAGLEGVIMFVVLIWVARKPTRRGVLSGLFALMYGVSRFAIEFVREPDEHLGYLAWDWLTMGQLLSLPLIALGIGLLWMSRKQPVINKLA